MRTTLLATMILFFSALYGAGVAAAGERLTQAAVAGGLQQLLAQGLTAMDEEDDAGEDHDDDSGEHDGKDKGGKLAGTWFGTVSFFDRPELDFSFTWKMTRLIEHFYLMEVTRNDDGAVQNGIAAQLTHGRPDVALHGGFGADAASCRYIYVGDAGGELFTGFANYICGDGTALKGAFTAAR